MRPEHIRHLAVQALETDEQRRAFEDALEQLSAADRLAMELLLAESGPLSGLRLGRINKLELLAKVAMFCAINKTTGHYRHNGRAVVQKEKEDETTNDIP